MKITKQSLIISLIIPIIALVILTGYKSYIFNLGKEVTLPIVGYDPRDLLSGHYLIYRVDYGIEDLCKAKRDTPNVYICLKDKKTVSYGSVPYDCDLYIKGKCTYNSFRAGIERFYIPEKDSVKLDRDVRDKKGSIVISVLSNGVAQVKKLLINGQEYK